MITASSTLLLLQTLLLLEFYVIVLYHSGGAVATKLNSTSSLICWSSQGFGLLTSWLAVRHPLFLCRLHKWKLGEPRPLLRTPRTSGELLTESQL